MNHPDRNETPTVTIFLSISPSLWIKYWDESWSEGETRLDLQECSIHGFKVEINKSHCHCLQKILLVTSQAWLRHNFDIYSKIEINKTSFTSTNVKLRLRFDVHLTFTWHSPEPHLTTWPSSDLPLTLTRPLPNLN